MSALRFTVPGDPQSLKRARVTVRRGNAMMYDPAENRAAKNEIVHAWSEAGGERWMDGTPLKVTIACFFRRPAAHFGTGRNAERLKDSAPRFVTRTPDVDNIGKQIGDALNGYCWRDDSQIADMRVTKVYCDPALGNGPCITVTVEALT